MTAQLARLLQLASTTLPVGAFSYSQGLEWAVEAGIVRDEATARDWLRTTLHRGPGSWDATWIAHLMAAWQLEDAPGIRSLGERFLASRETRELYLESRQMGRSMLAVARDDPTLPSATLTLMLELDAQDALCYPVAWTAVAAHRGLACGDVIVAYLWSWLESATLAAMKTVPLGQQAGQRLLGELGVDLEMLASAAAARPLDACSNFLPGLALASMKHETQYSRLFRS